jgi:Phospholipid methyltransferase
LRESAAKNGLYSVTQYWYAAARHMVCFIPSRPSSGNHVIVRIVKQLRSTSFRTFVLYPLTIAAWEWLINGGRLPIRPRYAPLLIWGYLQYRLIGNYRARHGSGGPGMDTLPERLVTTGPYAWCRNPMYLGHIVFLLGLTLTLQSTFGALITAATAVWFRFRVRRDETRLRERFGQPYQEYSARVKRWVPGLF